jgi:hypothetical protein
MTAGAAESETAGAPAAADHESSPRVSAVIRAELPRYAPAPSAENAAVTEPEGAGGEMKGDTLHLPTITVRESMKLPLTSTDWFTSQGRMEFALKQFPGTRIGNIFGLNNDWALARLGENIAASRHDELKDRGLSVLIEGTPEEKETRKLLKSALMYSGRPAPK